MTIVTCLVTLLCLMALAGCGSPQPPTPTATPRPTFTPPLIALATPGTAAPTVTATFPPCGTPPAGWAPYTVEAGDTLAALAARAGVALDSVLLANCRKADDLLRTGSTIFLPVRPTATPCPAPPAGWIPYIVEAGDTLATLAARAGVALDAVLLANCRKADDLLRTGSLIFLPVRPTATPCPAPPADWQFYIVRAGETLAGLADRAGIRPETIIQANCLASANLLPDQQLWLPPLRQPTATPCTARPPISWQPYIVQPGDTLFALAVFGGTTVAEIMRANCLASQNIVSGQSLSLPAAVSYRPTPAPPATGQAPAPLRPTVTRPPSCAEAPLTCGGPLAMPLFFAAPVGPNGQEDKIPCATSGGAPRIETTNNRLAVGERRFFFACGFNDAVSAIVRSGATFSRTLTLQTPPNPEPNPDWEPFWTSAPDQAKVYSSQYVTWLALPLSEYPRGSYTVIFTRRDNSMISEQFTVTLASVPRTERILVVPQIAHAGEPVDVYYVGFDMTRSAEIHLGYERGPTPTPSGHNFDIYRTFTLPTLTPLPGAAGKGWTVLRLTKGSADPLGAYSLDYLVGRASDVFWWK